MIVVRIIPQRSRWAGITLGEVVLTKRRPSPRTLRHERIHVQQYRELWYIGFLVLYGIDYLRRRRAGLRHFEAYRAISFEQEAYTYEDTADYLTHRQRHAWRQWW